MKRRLVIVMVMVTIESCRDPYLPPVSVDEVVYLSVEGKINASDGSATVKISRAVQLSSPNVFPTVDDAKVFIEEQSGRIYSILLDSNGIYNLTGADFVVGKNYRLKFELINGKKYSSDYIEMLQTPPIDSIWWQATSDGISIQLNATGSENDSRFFMWDFVETWQYHSELQSHLDVVNDVVVPRKFENEIYWCWRSDEATQILVESTEGLSQNLIKECQIVLLAPGTPKLLQEYSILVQQHSISKEAYAFQRELQKTNDNLGGLFDPLPFKVLGNIHNEDNSEEEVLGYFSGGTMTSKRIFIQYSMLPGFMQNIVLPKIDCKTEAIPLADIASRDRSLIVYMDYGEPVTLGYLFSSRDCVDCRTAGGTNIKPSFWR